MHKNNLAIMHISSGDFWPIEFNQIVPESERNPGRLIFMRLLK